MEGHGVVGFRFHPTEEEIISYFLERKMCGLDFPAHTIADVVDVCKYEPWDLPQRSRMPKEDRVWYFFNALVSKSPNSKLVNRQTNSGFWKPTGKDRVIWDEQGKKIGFKKNLVFHTGRAKNGIRTNWVMHEYHSQNASSYSKEFVLLRLKKKSGDKPDACNEPTPQPSAFDSGNGAIGNTNPQINRDLPEELQLLLSNPELDYSHLAEVLSNIQPAQGTSINSSGFDHNTLPALPSMVQPINSNGFHHNSLSSLLPEHGTSYSDGFNDELETSGQEDAFVNSLWACQAECSGERSMNTLRHDFNPTISLRGRSIGQSSDVDSKIYQQHGKVPGTSNVFYEKTHAQMETVWALSETSSSSEGYGIMDFDVSSVNSDTDLPGIVGHKSVVDELQHTPKYHKYFEARCSTQELKTQRKVSNKAVSKVEMGEAVHHAVDLPRTEKATMRLVKDKKMAQKTRERKDSNSSSNGSTSSSKKKLYISSLTAASDGAGSSNKRRSFISLEIPQLSHKTDPPSVYLLNVLVSLVLVIFIIREMAYLH
ncbi:NAC domain-containing protein JA2-like isoform X1 [Citrus sinensis]|nr:NAC domain-containing protein JA2-like isoform X1 [Citrus sinensis]